MDKDDPKSVTEWYNTLSPSYDQLYGNEQKLKHDKVMAFLKDRRIQVLVDIGCGTGQFLRRAQPLYEYGIGIDGSRRILENAKQRRTTKIDLVQAVSSYLPIKNRIIDCTVSISMAKADQTFSDLILETNRISTANACLAITVFQSGNVGLERLGSVKETLGISARETLYFLRPNSTLDQ